ncbi:MAG: hypothetical protein COU07_01780 [Candidatus Harrisonbacteria bacterium CG10_big_fil_rev_8_21_14_0_10_40_38]|uniref:Uncharacterized protein n=1 Tax=Candidatus Harrisonbacteria bacterium CG10_big_fil_rev_8_21_14_0_10_40_38 TaxID=1974583 RepID=A0A2H0UVB8_9BACT|nr:MAG: hypothetical protein COU07_01780 [Candidatus Harrisonbacteria bacterium CG10_big_fil_rev_8_21_14_0_10_40_38]
MISEQALQDFMTIWREEKGEEISREEALEEATALLTIMNVTYRPIRKEWLQEYLEKHPEDRNDYDPKHEPTEQTK